MATPMFSKKLATSTGMAEPPTKEESRQPPRGAYGLWVWVVAGEVWRVGLAEHACARGDAVRARMHIRACTGLELAEHDLVEQGVLQAQEHPGRLARLLRECDGIRACCFKGALAVIAETHTHTHTSEECTPLDPIAGKTRIRGLRGSVLPHLPGGASAAARRRRGPA